MIVSLNLKIKDANDFISLVTKRNAISFNKEAIYILNDNVTIKEVSAFNAVTILKEETPAYYLVTREYKKEDTIIKVGRSKIGDKKLTFMAGPCSIENEKSYLKIATQLKEMKVSFLRGGAYKLRTSPYTFQGLGKDGLDIILKEKHEVKLPVIAEITDINELKYFVKNVDIIQVGARNMFNYEMLKKLGTTQKPILLKRGIGATIEEFLGAAEYILKGGNFNVILCERGIKTYENMERNTLDINSIPLLKKLTHLPVIVDPSHASGDATIVKDLALAGVASGADGLLIEVHENPAKSLSDSKQAISLASLKEIIDKANKIAKIIK